MPIIYIWIGYVTTSFWHSTSKEMVIFWKSVYAIVHSYTTFKLSSYRKQLSEYLNLGNATVFKLVPNLQNRTNYVVQDRNRISNIFTIGRGVELSKIHRVVVFKQCIAHVLDSSQRIRERLYKLMKYGMVGKTIENLKNRINVYKAGQL